MRVLVAEDDLASRKFLLKLLEPYGECDYSINGIETLDAFLTAHGDKRPYDLICLDIMMPKADGIKVLKNIREFEKQNRISDQKKVKIIMTTALNDDETISVSYDIGCSAYIPKPIDADKLINEIKKLGLIKE